MYPLEDLLQSLGHFQGPRTGVLRLRTPIWRFQEGLNIHKRRLMVATPGSSSDLKRENKTFSIRLHEKEKKYIYNKKPPSVNRTAAWRGTFKIIDITDRFFTNWQQRINVLSLESYFFPIKLFSSRQKFWIIKYKILWVLWMLWKSVRISNIFSLISYEENKEFRHSKSSESRFSKSISRFIVSLRTRRHFSVHDTVISMSCCLGS